MVFCRSELRRGKEGGNGGARGRRRGRGGAIRGRRLERGNEEGYEEIMNAEGRELE